MEEQIEEEGGLIPENTDLIDLMESDHEDEEFDDEIEEEQGKTQEEKEQEEEACCICQDAVTVLTQGFLPACDHRFHFDCILTWSKVTNLCPLCKKRFNEIKRVDEEGNILQREKIKNVKQVHRPNPEDHDIEAQLRLIENICCSFCATGDNEEVLLICEERNCTIACHTYCIGLSEVPNGAWYCDQHQSRTRVSDYFERPAMTVSSRRQTRRLASLMTNVLTRRTRTPTPSTTRRNSASQSTRRRNSSRRIRTTIDSEEARPIRGIAGLYALRMSRELQQVQRRADAMFERGEHLQLGLHTVPVTREPPTRGTERLQESRKRPLSGSHSEGTHLRFRNEYRELKQLMLDAANQDDYASSVSLAIPKTARLRIVSRVKAFFSKLSESEKKAALDMGVLEALHSWIRLGKNGSGGEDFKTFHPQVLDAVLTVLEVLPVEKEKLLEVPQLQSTIDTISEHATMELALKYRAQKLSTSWKLINPPVSTQTSSIRMSFSWNPTSTASPRRLDPSLPQITSFISSSQDHSKSRHQRKEKEHRKEGDETPQNDVTKWSPIVVDYINAKLYPLYKKANKLTKERYKSIVKQVFGTFKTEAGSLRSNILDGNNQLSELCKNRLKTLIDREYRATSSSSGSSVGISAAYSSVPSTTS